MVQTRYKQASDKHHSSELQEKRRQHIIQVLREEISREGLADITMRGLAIKADVATRTLYNLFGSKDDMISYAVHDSFDEVLKGVTTSAKGKTALDKLVEYTKASAKFNTSNPGYVSALLYIYYSADASAVSFHNSTINYLKDLFKQLLIEMKEERVLQPWASPEVVARQLAENIINNTAEWTRGKMPKQQYMNTCMLDTLSLIYPVVNAAQQKKFAGTIEQLHKKLK